MRQYTYANWSNKNYVLGHIKQMILDIMTIWLMYYLYQDKPCKIKFTSHPGMQITSFKKGREGRRQYQWLYLTLQERKSSVLLFSVLMWTTPRPFILSTVQITNLADDGFYTHMEKLPRLTIAIQVPVLHLFLSLSLNIHTINWLLYAAAFSSMGHCFLSRWNMIRTWHLERGLGHNLLIKSVTWKMPEDS